MSSREIVNLKDVEHGHINNIQRIDKIYLTTSL